MNQPAMTEEELLQAISIGMELVWECKEKGYELLATGEMGIGNTTTAAAVTAALLGRDAVEMTGRGAGLDDTRFQKKQRVIQEALEKYALWGKDPFTILRTVGGLDIAGLTGVFLGGAVYHVPIVLDGVISAAAALAAERLCPGAKAYMIPSHMGKEGAMAHIFRELELEPVIYGELAVGEGSGAVLLFPLLDLMMDLYQKETTFQDFKMEPYQRNG